MPGPQPDELVFEMSNDVKTDVRFRMKNRHNKFVRTLAKVLPRSTLKRKLRSKKPVVGVEPTGWEGICCALSCMYLQLSHELGNVTTRNQVDGNRFKLTIAQAAYEKHPGTGGADVEAVLSVFKMRVVNQWVSHTVQDLVDHVCANPGRYLAHVFYDSGNSHFIALRRHGGANFIFEPEEGLYRFNSDDRFEDALIGHLVGQDLGADNRARFWETELD